MFSFSIGHVSCETTKPIIDNFFMNASSNSILTRVFCMSTFDYESFYIVSN